MRWVRVASYWMKSHGERLDPWGTPQSQRRVTFHLPDGSQESCSDSGLGDHEPVGCGTLISHPLPLVQPQDEFYEQASPDKRTEADGNSDPNSDEMQHHISLSLSRSDSPTAKFPSKVPEYDGPLGPRGLAEATEMCTQECLLLGHSDNCWMPPGLGPYQQPQSPLSTFAAQKEWSRKDTLVNGHTLTRTWKEDNNRNQFSDRKPYANSEGHYNSGSHINDIPLANLKSFKQAAGVMDSPKEHQL
ncbi:protocadherin-9-like [Ambystoma mexicanum]|uniref:protocadherin-9-like n=1 Tax=Ambystoma mexicanum TaxID=8296 RepID=UPI0037E8D132